jgi:hypothetical protein
MKKLALLTVLAALMYGGVLYAQQSGPLWDCTTASTTPCPTGATCGPPGQTCTTTGPGMPPFTFVCRGCVPGPFFQCFPTTNCPGKLANNVACTCPCRGFGPLLC